MQQFPRLHALVAPTLCVQDEALIVRRAPVYSKRRGQTRATKCGEMAASVHPISKGTYTGLGVVHSAEEGSAEDHCRRDP